MVVPEPATAFGGGIGGGGGGGGGKDGPGEIEAIGESSSVNRSKMLSSKDGSLLSLPKSLEKPDATSSSCCTGCLGRRGKNLLSAPLVVVEVDVEEMTTALLDETALKEVEAA